jgi:hypothetical protein
MSVAGVAFAVLLILIIVSLYRGWSGASELFSELPGDLWVAQAGTTDPFRAASHLPADRLGARRRIGRRIRRAVRPSLSEPVTG